MNQFHQHFSFQMQRTMMNQYSHTNIGNRTDSICIENVGNRNDRSCWVCSRSWGS
jgi:hypothetical protein